MYSFNLELASAFIVMLNVLDAVLGVQSVQYNLVLSEWTRIQYCKKPYLWV